MGNPLSCRWSHEPLLPSSTIADSCSTRCDLTLAILEQIHLACYHFIIARRVPVTTGLRQLDCFAAEGAPSAQIRPELVVHVEIRVVNPAYFPILAVPSVSRSLVCDTIAQTHFDMIAFHRDGILCATIIVFILGFVSPTASPAPTHRLPFRLDIRTVPLCNPRGV